MKENTETKELAVAGATNALANPIDNWFEGSPVYAKLASLSDKFSKSELCPEQFKGKPHDCFIALQIANRIGIDPFMALQNLNVVRGRPSWSAQFVISLCNERGPFSTKIKFDVEGSGQELAVTASATMKDSGQVVSATVSLAMAVAEGWVAKNTKYKTMPEQMLCYRSAVFLVRRYCPEILVGMPTTDETTDVAVSGARNVGPEISSKTQKLNDKIKGAKVETQTETEKTFI